MPAGEGHATRKYDGTCVLLDDNGNWWARREIKPGKARPPMEQSAYAQWHAEGLGGRSGRRDAGTYELCGPKVQGDPEGFGEHVLIRHAEAELAPDAPRHFDGLRQWLLAHDWEGLLPAG